MLITRTATRLCGRGGLYAARAIARPFATRSGSDEVTWDHVLAFVGITSATVVLFHFMFTLPRERQAAAAEQQAALRDISAKLDAINATLARKLA